MKPEGSLLCTQKPMTDSSPEPDNPTHINTPSPLTEIKRHHYINLPESQILSMPCISMVNLKVPI
jgi:hypothetical protein